MHDLARWIYSNDYLNCWKRDEDRGYVNCHVMLMLNFGFTKLFKKLYLNCVLIIEKHFKTTVWLYCMCAYQSTADIIIISCENWSKNIAIGLYSIVLLCSEIVLYCHCDTLRLGINLLWPGWGAVAEMIAHREIWWKIKRPNAAYVAVIFIWNASE